MLFDDLRSSTGRTDFDWVWDPNDRPVVGENEESRAYVSQDGACSGNQPCFSSVQLAIDDSVNETVIQITGEDYDEAVTLVSPKELKLSGGWTADFSSQSTPTAVNSLTMEAGLFFIEFIKLNGD